MWGSNPASASGSGDQIFTLSSLRPIWLTESGIHKCSSVNWVGKVLFLLVSSNIPREVKLLWPTPTREPDPPRGWKQGTGSRSQDPHRGTCHASCFREHSGTEVKRCQAARNHQWNKRNQFRSLMVRLEWTWWKLAPLCYRRFLIPQRLIINFILVPYFSHLINMALC